MSNVLSNMEVLATTGILKCRFCEHDHDDPDRMVTVGKGLLKDLHYDLLYDLETNTIREAVYESEYAVVECPSTGCSKYFQITTDCSARIEEIDLKDILVRTEETDDRFLIEFPAEESINIKRHVEHGTVICCRCPDTKYDPDDLQSKVFRVVYIPWMSHTPLVAVMCDRHNCHHILSLLKKGGHYHGLVQLRESELLKQLGLTAEPAERLEVYDEEKYVREVLIPGMKKFVSLPETRILTVLENILSRLYGKKVGVILPPSLETEKIEEILSGRAVLPEHARKS